MTVAEEIDLGIIQEMRAGFCIYCDRISFDHTNTPACVHRKKYVQRGDASCEEYLPQKDSTKIHDDFRHSVSDEEYKRRYAEVLELVKRVMEGGITKCK